MTWLRKITVRTLRHLEPIEIDLTPGDDRDRLHLVLLGPNASGKTSLLDALADELSAAIDERLHPAVAAEEAHGDAEALDRELRIAHIGRPVRLRWSEPSRLAPAWRAGRLVLAHVRASRRIAFGRARGPAPVDPAPKRPSVEEAPNLPHFLLQRAREATFARQSGDELRARVHEAWLLHVQRALRRLLQQPNLSVAADRDGFHLDLSDGRRMHLDELSRGHAAALAIWAEVLLRVEAARARADDPGLEPAGIVVIDSPEIDLDVRLQRELLPALTELYPRIQWVLATHSPLVVMSLDDAVVYDLARRRARSSFDIRRSGVDALLASMIGSRSSHAPATSVHPSAPLPGRLPPCPSSAPPPARRRSLGGTAPRSADDD